MRVTLKATRVYATKDQYGPEPRMEAAESHPQPGVLDEYVDRLGVRRGNVELDDLH